MKTSNHSQVKDLISNLKKSEVVTIATQDEFAMGTFDSFESDHIVLFPYYTANSFIRKSNDDKLRVHINAIKEISC